jgi:hypothetical protein
VLKLVSPKAGQCYERALQAHERADAAIDPVARNNYPASETRWPKLAQSYEPSGRLSHFLKRPEIFPKHPECANCHVPMWLTEIHTSCERMEYFFECKASEDKVTLTE